MFGTYNFQQQQQQMDEAAQQNKKYRTGRGY